MYYKDILLTKTLTVSLALVLKSHLTYSKVQMAMKYNISLKFIHNVVQCLLFLPNIKLDI